MDPSRGTEKNYTDNERPRPISKDQPSMSSLILWNISKALEKDPHMDIRRAMRSAHERMEHQSHDVNGIISQDPEERYIACAVLAWQQLGHRDTDSLYEFIESHRNKVSRDISKNSCEKENICSVNCSDASKRINGFIGHNPSMDWNSVCSTSFDTQSLMGPVVRLPVETKVVMRVENTPHSVRQGAKKTPRADVTSKIDTACCLDSACIKGLKEMEKTTAELRARATQLARREAERGELLERAEAAWQDLELGYQRRLLLAEEKEDDLTKQIKKSIEDRNAYKHACTVLAMEVGKRGEIVEKDRTRLTQIEKEVCDLACTRLRLIEESAKGEAAVADEHCKTVQFERDLQFKEEQVRRKLASIESVRDSARGLALESERAMREELCMLKEQIAQISSQLLEEDAESKRIQLELDELRQQKDSMFEDLEGCKRMCDSRMQDIADELHKKRQILKELKDKVVECQCKLPLDVAVEAKRTPSLAALCRCTAEDHIIHSCSCTSVRSTLLSNLLSDLFAGLQAELGDTGSLMPCQLLKCLEDKHNWDRASIVKSNLRSFFSRLLVGELDTAIATSIEKYHATWVGVSCADKTKIIPDPGNDDSDDWQQRVVEKRAQKLAGQLAEQLFQERADQLVEKAKEIVASGPPPCECRPHSNKPTAYPCLVKPPTIGSTGKKNDTSYPTYVKRTLQDVTMLKTQLEELKKETIKKEDLKSIEEKLTDLVRASGVERTDAVTKNTSIEDDIMKQKTTHRSMNTDAKEENGAKTSFIKKKTINTGPLKKNFKKATDINSRILEGKLTGKTVKKLEPSYAVNLCLFDGKNKPGATSQNMKYLDDFNSWNENVPQRILSQISSTKQTRPITKIFSKNNETNKNKKRTSKTTCLNRCTCFHKIPSNTSLDKLLETLLRWKGDLVNNSVFQTMPSSMSKSNNNNIKEIHHGSEISNNKKSVHISEVLGAKSENFSNIEVIKTPEIDQLPPVTTSEYIGAINLDKSNEHICKCDKKNNLKQGDNNNINLLFKCLDTSKCSCKNSNNVDKFRNTELNKETVHLKDKGLYLEQSIHRKSEKNNILEQKLFNVQACNSYNPMSNQLNSQTLQNNFISSDREFHVKFLGVTLADTNNGDANNTKIETKYNKNTYITSVSKNKQSDFYSKGASIKSSGQKQRSDINYINEKTEYPTRINQDQSVELDISLDDTVTNYNNKNDYGKITCLDEILSNKKSCVCCNYNDSTKNLEVNTFTLLEKHLKHKLAEFRKSSGKSILPDEEEKVFMTILNKVKQVISNYAFNVKCECSLENKKSGSWIRFNSLLEEYLKIKIKRVQCSCIPNAESLETILPGVLEQVSNLIENDFERLKNLCKLEKTNSLEYGENNYKNKSDQKNINNIKNQHVEPVVPTIDLANVSIQGSCSFGIEDKSCDAIQLKDTKDIQTSHSALLMESHSVEVIISHCCNLNNELAFNTCASKKEMNQKSQIILCEEPLNITQNKNSSKNCSIVLGEMNSHGSLEAPYVGYTLSCSCENFNNCNYFNHLNRTHVKNIHKIWKMLEVNKELLPNLSYIMHSIPKTVRSEDNIIKYVTETPYVPLIPELQRVKDVSACNEDEIILKDSDIKLKHSGIIDHMTNTLDDLVSVKTECFADDDAFNWYDCCPSPHSAKNQIVHKKAFYDSIYSPIGKFVNHGKSDNSIKSEATKSKNCDCVMVPVCHVKMLVENIENKLVNSQCTCDSLSAQVCPLHSKTPYF